MKLALLCLCLVHVASVHAGFLTRNDLQVAHSHVSGGRAKATQSTGSLNHIRQRPLFARRGQYERLSVPKSRGVHVSRGHAAPTKGVPKPVQLCSTLAQSCLPQSGCCDPHTVCHCRFFNAICFCRRTKEQ